MGDSSRIPGRATSPKARLAVGSVARGLGMAGLTALIALLAVTLHLWRGYEISRPISLELADGNPLARLLMVALMGLVLLLALRIRRNGHAIRAGLLILNAAGVVALAFTDANSSVHEAILTSVFGLTITWFAVMGFEYDASEVTTATILCIYVSLALTLVSLGIGERFLIFYCLYCGNTLYYRYLGDDARPKWW